MDNRYLVISDITTSDDGGHFVTIPKCYWVEAGGKQEAAAIAAIYAKDEHGPKVVSTRIVRVLSKDDWGHRYFTAILPGGPEADDRDDDWEYTQPTTN